MTTEIEVPTLSASEYAVEVFKRTHRAGDVGQWERADAIRAAVDGELSPAPGAGEISGDGNDGSYKVIERLYVELSEAGVPDVAVNTIAKYRTVAQAWPDHERIPKASYDAHRELAGKKFNGRRRGVLERLLERSSKKYVTRADVRTWKSEQSKKPGPSTWGERFTKKAGGLLKGDLRPQGPNEWAHAVRELERLLVEAREAAE